MNPYVDIYKASETLHFKRSFRAYQSLLASIGFLLTFTLRLLDKLYYRPLLRRPTMLSSLTNFYVFYINRMDVLPRSILNRIILDNFNDEDILSAKDTLHSHVSTTLKHRRIKRQGADKAKHNVDDISKILDEVDPDANPIYATRDLGTLPTIDFNHVDMSTLSREITTCKSKLYDTLNYLIKLLSIQCLNFLRKSPLLCRHCYRYFLH